MISNIQLLRAFASTNVLLYHVIEQSAVSDSPVKILALMEGWGASGVDMFFVISGFIMVHTQMKSERKPKDFLLQRIIRIVPLYWLALSIVLIAVLLLDGKLFQSTEISAGWIAASYLFVAQILYDGTAPLVKVGWTLELEMFFYTIFALSLFIQSWLYRMVAVTIILVAAAALTHQWLIIEFLFGMGIALSARRITIQTKQANNAFWLGAVMLALTIFIPEQSMDYRLLFWGVPAFFIVIGAIYGRVVPSGIGQYIGKISYSIYLTHALTLAAFYKLVEPRFLSETNCDLNAMLSIIASFMVALLAYHLFEKPVSDYFNRISRHKKNALGDASMAPQ